MQDEPAAEAWVQERLGEARTAYSSRAPGPGDLSLEEYERRLRGTVAACLRPTDVFLGLDVPSAEELARETQQRLCVHRGQTGHRADWRADRVHVELGADGLVSAARRDRAPWLR